MIEMIFQTISVVLYKNRHGLFSFARFERPYIFFYLLHEMFIKRHTSTRKLYLIFPIQVSSQVLFRIKGKGLKNEKYLGMQKFVIFISS